MLSRTKHSFRRPELSSENGAARLDASNEMNNAFSHPGCELQSLPRVESAAWFCNSPRAVCGLEGKMFSHPGCNILRNYEAW
jgi:hypothetical protein